MKAGWTWSFWSGASGKWWRSREGLGLHRGLAQCLCGLRGGMPPRKQFQQVPFWGRQRY